MTVLSVEASGACYDGLAPFYDVLTEGHDYELWVQALLPALRDAGLRGREVLDVACGTGKSAEPFMRRGYRVTGVDVSGPMLEVAARRVPEAHLVIADIRELPALGTFDLVVCLDDGINYLDSATELLAFLVGVRRNLRPGGLLVFDVNTLHAYREHFSGSTVVRADDELVLLWCGETPPDLPPGGRATLTIEAIAQDGGGWGRHRSRHAQRHHPDARVRGALAAAGLRLLDIASHGFDAVLTRPAEPDRHNKLVYIARRDPPPAPDLKEVNNECSRSCTPANRSSPRRPSSRAAETAAARVEPAARAVRP